MKRHSSFRGLRAVGGSIGFAIVILGVLSMTSCDWLFGSGTKVYVSGYYGTGTSDSVACYWEGATRHDLPSGGLAAEAASIFLAGDSVYVAGSYKDGSNIYYACGWKDGVKTDLSAPVASNDVRATAVFAYGADTYHAGYYYDNAAARFKAAYWKNGAITTLAVPGTEFAKAAAIDFDGVTLRVAGFYAATDEKACLWTNGSIAALSVPVTATKSKAYSVRTADGHVYVAGYHTNGTVKTACVWTDGVRTDLSAGTDGSASSVYKADGSIYAAGFLKDGTIPTASVWTGSTQEFLPGVDGHMSGASGIVVYDGSTYVSGYYASAADVAIPCYWFQDSVRDLPTVGGKAGFTTSIAVHNAG